MEISQNFVGFSEYMNFKKQNWISPWIRPHIQNRYLYIFFQLLCPNTEFEEWALNFICNLYYTAVYVESEKTSPQNILASNCRIMSRQFQLVTKGYMFLLLCIPIHTMTSDGMFSTFCPDYEIITFFQGVLGTHSFSFLMLSNFCLITLNSISLTNFNNKCNVWPILTLFLNSLNFTLISSFIHTFWSLYHAFNHDNFRGGGILKFCYNTKCALSFWSKLVYWSRKMFLNTNLFLIKLFLFFKVWMYTLG